MEYSEWDLSITNHVKISLIYRSPCSSANQGMIPGFFSSFEEYLESVITTRHNVIILGDFNFYMNIIDDSNAKRFRLLMNTFGLLNFVHFTTHISGHALDLVLTRVIDKIQPLSTEPCDSISDHVPVLLRDTG